MPTLIDNRKREWLDGEALVRIGVGLEEGHKREDVAADLGISPGRLKTFLAENGIAGEAVARQTRFKPKANKGVMEPKSDHPAVVEGRALFQHGLRDPADDPDRDVHISCINNAKIGKVVQRGRLKGFPIYHLSLEERRTCPRACEQWRTCYGNGMHWAARHVAGEALERALSHNVARLAKKHPDGFLVRLHTLGDFYSWEYARLWDRLLEKHKRLHVFGYTRRQPGSEIGDEIEAIRSRHGFERFAMRFSGLTGKMNSFVLPGTIRTPKLADAFVCKQEWAAENGSLDMNCATCAACWEDRRAVVFVEH